MVFELLAADMREPDETPDNQSSFWSWAGEFGIAGSDRLPSKFDAGAGQDFSPGIGHA